MDNVQNEVSAEELAEEQKTLESVKEEDVRQSVVSEYGFDEIDDAEKIDKVVEKEMTHRKELSEAIGQKIKQRDAKNLLAEENAKLKTPPTAPVTKVPDEDLDKKLDQKLGERFEKRDLDAMSYPDELKEKIQKVAKINETSIKEAVKDPWIVSQIEEYESTVKMDEATISRTHKSGGKTSYDLDNPPEVDINTPEGVKEWDKYKEEMRKKHPYQGL